MLSKIVLNSSAFLSGCLPVALIQVSRFSFSDVYNVVPASLSVAFLFLTILASVCLWRYFSITFSKANVPCKVSNLKRKDMFSSGALNYYILPFVFFIGDNMQSVLTLFVITIALLVIFNNNMMFMYTPLLDFLGYKILEGEVSDLDGKNLKVAMIVVKSDKGIFFTGSNRGVMNRVSEDVYFFVKDEEETERCIPLHKK